MSHVSGAIKSLYRENREVMVKGIADLRRDLNPLSGNKEVVRRLLKWGSFVVVWAGLFGASLKASSTLGFFGKTVSAILPSRTEGAAGLLLSVSMKRTLAAVSSDNPFFQRCNVLCSVAALCLSAISGLPLIDVPAMLCSSCLLTVLWLDKAYSLLEKLWNDTKKLRVISNPDIRRELFDKEIKDGQDVLSTPQSTTELSTSEDELPAKLEEYINSSEPVVFKDSKGEVSYKLAPILCACANSGANVLSDVVWHIWGKTYLPPKSWQQSIDIAVNVPPLLDNGCYARVFPDPAISAEIKDDIKPSDMNEDKLLKIKNSYCDTASRIYPGLTIAGVGSAVILVGELLLRRYSSSKSSLISWALKASKTNDAEKFSTKTLGLLLASLLGLEKLLCYRSVMDVSSTCVDGKLVVTKTHRKSYAINMFAKTISKCKLTCVILVTVTGITAAGIVMLPGIYGVGSGIVGLAVLYNVLRMKIKEGLKEDASSVNERDNFYGLTLAVAGSSVACADDRRLGAASHVMAMFLEGASYLSVMVASSFMLYKGGAMLTQSAISKMADILMLGSLCGFAWKADSGSRIHKGLKVCANVLLESPHLNSPVKKLVSCGIAAVTCADVPRSR